MNNLGAKSFTPIEVTRFIRRMPGSSQPFLVECEDRKPYILKLNGNPQGPNLLANEFLGSGIGRAVGLPFAEVTPLLLKRSFLRENEALRFDTGRAVWQPEPGLHFGCRMCGAPSGPSRVLQLIGPRDVARISNLNDFLGMYLLDVWAMHADRREAVFIRHTKGNRKSPRETLFGIFIDNGHLFKGPHWESDYKRYFALHLERSVYHGLWNEKAVRTWTKSFQKAIPPALGAALRILPRDWYTGDLNAVSELLLSRLRDLPSLFESHSFEKMKVMESTSHEDMWLRRGWAHH